MFDSGPSISDIAAVTRDNEGFGNGAWIIILLFAIFGWGRGGYGGSSVQEGYALATDVATLERQIDGVDNGLCDGFYAQNTTLLNGFAGVQSSIKDVQTGMVINAKDFQAQAQQNHCETLQAIHSVQDGIINYLNAQKMQDLRDENFQYKLAASQEAQNNYLVNTLRPMPIPAYQSFNPWATQSYGCATTCGC